MKIEALHIYPIKSVAAVDVLSAVCAERGFEGDRRYMIVDADGVFLTQRTVPELGLIHAQLSPEGILLTANDRETLFCSAEYDRETSTKVRVWDDEVEALSSGPAIDHWISEVIGQPAHLVLMPRSAVRLINPDRGRSEVSFADGYPYLVASSTSLADLNRRILEANSSKYAGVVPMAAFRPNFVVSGGQPWAEDTWKRLRVGEAEFELVSPCERCKITTLDPLDPRRVRADQEPLRTMAKFRRDGDGVIFASNAVCLTPGITIRVGDSVEVLE